MFTWICPQCGKEVPPAYTDCPNCAEKAAQAAQQAAQAPAPPPAQPEPAPAYVPPPPFQQPAPQYQPPPPQYQAPPYQAPQYPPQAPPPPPYNYPPQQPSRNTPQQPPPRDTGCRSSPNAGLPTWLLTVLVAGGTAAGDFRRHLAVLRPFGIEAFDRSGKSRGQAGLGHQSDSKEH